MNFEKVQQHAQRLAQMRQQIAELDAEAESLGNAVAVTLAAGQDATQARARRAEVRQLRADLREAAELLEVQLGTDREAAGQAEAEQRMVGIARAFGSVRQQLDEDEAKVREAAWHATAAADRVNERFRALEMLRAEANALAERFGLAAPAFPPVVIPARREGCAAAVMAAQAITFLDHAHMRPDTEQDEHGVRVRRTYREIEATEGYRIIMAAGGPKGWPELTERQRAILAEREREKVREAAEMQRFAAQADRSLSRREM